MNCEPFTSCSLFFASSASNKELNIGVIKLHDFIELNGEKYESTDELAKMTAGYIDLYINAHLCLDTIVLIEVMEKVRKYREGLIHVGTFGSHDDGTCH